MVKNLRRLCQKPARPDAYPPLKCSRGATVCDTFSLPAPLFADTLSYCVAFVSPIRNQRVTLGTTTDDGVARTAEMPLARKVVDSCQLAPMDDQTRWRQVAH